MNGINFKTFIPVTDDCVRIKNPYLYYLPDDLHLTMVDEDVAPHSPLFSLIKRSKIYTQYWVWKNCDLEYYGFAQCDRFLYLKKKNEISGVREDIRIPKINEDSILDLGYHSSNVNQFLENETIFIGAPTYIDIKNASNIYQLYKLNNELDIKCLDCTIQILHDLYPGYSVDLKEYLSGAQCYSNNLFIMCNSVFKRYCDWLFHILEEVSTRLRSTGDVNKLMYNAD